MKVMKEMQRLLAGRSRGRWPRGRRCWRWSTPTSPSQSPPLQPSGWSRFDFNKTFLVIFVLHQINLSSDEASSSDSDSSDDSSEVSAGDLVNNISIISISD